MIFMLMSRMNSTTYKKKFESGKKFDVRVLFLALLNSDAYSVLPEIYEVFGREQTLKFLDVFAGSTIKVPTRKKLQECIRDVDIFCTLEYTKHPPTKKELADQYDLSESSIKEIYKRVKSLTKDFSKTIVKLSK